jgi:hypothetical protein
MLEYRMIKEFLGNRERLWRRGYLFAIALILFGVGLQVTLSDYPYQRLAPPEFKGPVLAVQLPTSEDDLQWALGVGTGYAEGIDAVLFANTTADFFFIACYTGFLICFSSYIAAQLPIPDRPKYIFCALVLLTAAADIIENLGILYALKHAGGSASWISTASYVKWTFFNISLLAIGALMFRIEDDPPFGQPLTGLLTLLFLGSGFVGLLGWSTASHFHHGAVLFAPIPLATVLWPLLKKYCEPMHQSEIKNDPKLPSTGPDQAPAYTP